MKPTRRDAKLAQTYAKDPRTENFLDSLNETLGPLEQNSYLDLPERHPTLHVVGAPRSGTTLLTQLIASQLGIACVNNLVAAFWAAPCHGLSLSRKLLPSKLDSNYSSDYGRTSKIDEPHEFGYFWSSILGYSEMTEPEDPEDQEIDWQRFQKTITNMTYTSDGPIVFKSMMLGFYLEQAQRALPRTCVVYITRDKVENALSILKYRRKYSGGAQYWTSLMPREYPWLRHETPAIQAAGQVKFVNQAYQRAFERVRWRNVLTIQYEKLCDNPGEQMNLVRDLLNRNGASIPLQDHNLPALSTRLAQEDEPGDRTAVGSAQKKLEQKHRALEENSD